MSPFPVCISSLWDFNFSFMKGLFDHSKPNKILPNLIVGIHFENKLFSKSNLQLTILSSIVNLCTYDADVDVDVDVPSSYYIQSMELFEVCKGDGSGLTLNGLIYYA